MTSPLSSLLPRWRPLRACCCIALPAFSCLAFSCLAFSCLAFSCLATGADVLRLEAQRVSSPGLELSGLQVELGAGSEPHLNLRLTSLQLGNLAFSNLGFRCSRAQVTSARFLCEDLGGDLRTEHSEQPVTVDGDLDLDLRKSTARLALTVSVDGASARISGRVASPGISELEIELQQFRLGLLADVFSDLGLTTMNGNVSGRLSVRLRDLEPVSLIANLDLRELDFDTQGGEYAGAGIGISVAGEADFNRQGTDLTLEARWTVGEVLVGPVYLPQPAQPLEIKAAVRVDDQRARFSELSLNDGDALRVRVEEGRVSWGEEPLLSGLARIEHADLGLVFQRYLKSLAAGVGMGKLELAGMASGQLRVTDSGLDHVALNLDDLFLDDPGGRFSVQRGRGRLAWSAGTSAERGDLRWEGLTVYRFNIGPASMEYLQDADGITLRTPLTIPVMDGALELQTLQFRMADGELESFDLQADLQPISMESLSAALQWPRLSGSLSGRIPAVSYDAGILAIEGAIALNAFDGDITLRDLTLERPFGVLPSMAANIEVERIDLEVLTRAFEFGLIEGQLSGHVKNLRMLNWSPVAFDAALANPTDDPRPHRISQRAIENISSIGGSGAGAALSRGFLGFFDDFRYDRLGITCVLRNHVCEMGGVGPTGQGGYYLVRGAGIPRLDVVAYAREVDWPTLVRRLKAASSARNVTVD